ncbi:hypothetical protein OTU49_011712, partial [Cherax quadricarinatus]
KHARPMFYINCGYRDLCYCYSKITRHHYCCSCDVGSCFPAHARLPTPTGATTTMGHLRTGDQVLAVDESGKVVPTTILGFMDRRPREAALYVTLRTSMGHNLTLSPNHVLFKSAPNSSHPVSVFGSDINIGDVIYSTNQTGIHKTEIIAIDHEVTQGAYVPLTREGTLVVEGIVVSCYASYKHSLAHTFLAPARIFPALLYLRPGFVSRLVTSVENLAGNVMKTLLLVLQDAAGGGAGRGKTSKVQSITKDGMKDTRFEDVRSDDVPDGEGEAYYISLVKLVGWLLYRKEKAAPQVLQVRAVVEDGWLQVLRLPYSLPQMTYTILGLLARSW